jgi:hypothetical protein
MTKRNAPTRGSLAALAILAQAIALSACGGSNAPSTIDVMTGGAGSGATSGAAGAASTGAAGATSTGAAGATSTGAAGTGAAAGTSGAAGATTGAAGHVGAAGTGGGMFTPLCTAVPATAGGMAPAKGVPCAATDTQLCYKTCGPLSVGFKSETCTAGAYAEMTGCSFPAGMDYSCYKIPAAIDASCPATPPQASQPCTVAMCTLCNAGGSYLDSTGASKPGYCVCPAAGAGGTRKWSCASATAWPCPAGQGC